MVAKGALYVGILSLLLVALFKPPVAVILGVLFTLLVAVVGYSYFSWGLLCPNCGRQPISNPALADPEDATFCPHCMHYLTGGSE